MQKKLGILGAGSSGLSLALLTHLDYLLIERDDQMGGHATSTAVDGWVFDRGPHIMFSRNPLLLDCMVDSLGDNVHQCRRNNRVSVAGVMARYPIENDLAALPLPLRSDVLISLIEAQQADHDIHNLAEWFVANFGEVLTDQYFRPYNEKVWNVPLEELSMLWAERIPRPPLADVVRGAMGELSEGYLHQLYYSYPRRGGYSALMDAWSAGVPADRTVLDSPVKRIVPAAESVRVEADGAYWDFDLVVSTLPVKYLVQLVPDVPTEVLDAVDRLVVNPMLVITLGFEGVDPLELTAVYIPDADYLVNRISYPAVFSPHNAPDGCFSIQAEITTKPGDEVMTWSDDQVVEHVVDGLRSRSLITDATPLVFSCVERFDQAYVVYTQGFEGDVKLVKDWFAERHIILHGRFGAHEYLNVDGCLDRSIELARALGADLTDDDVRETFKRLGQR